MTQITTKRTPRAWRRRIEATTCTCTECGTPFKTVHPSRAKFCSNACRTAAARRRAADRLKLEPAPGVVDLV